MERDGIPKELKQICSIILIRLNQLNAEILIKESIMIDAIQLSSRVFEMINRPTEKVILLQAMMWQL
ncbi:MAG: hypothetical protein ACXQTE_05645 [Methanosarcinaceae archaeon]